MRYFAVMSDDRILPAEDIDRGQFVDGVQFSVGTTRYKYLPDYSLDHGEYEGYRYKIHKHQHFFKRIYSDWFATENIKMLILLDEKENTDLNYFQSTDFNAGLIYGKVERNTVSLLKDTDTMAVSEIYIPAVQLVPSNCTALKELDIIEATTRTVTEHFEAVYGKNFTLDFKSWKRDKQYFRFDYSVTRKEVYKEMTVSEIEEALGYKIKVVSEEV